MAATTSLTSYSRVTSALSTWAAVSGPPWAGGGITQATVAPRAASKAAQAAPIAPAPPVTRATRPASGLVGSLTEALMAVRSAGGPAMSTWGGDPARARRYTRVVLVIKPLRPVAKKRQGKS